MKHEFGFSLIELLTVVAIIGVLAAIALPTYHSFEQSSYENTVRQDVRSVAGTCEAYFVEHQTYPIFGPFTGVKGSSNFHIAPGYGIKLSEGVTVRSVLLPNNSLNIIGKHAGATQTITIIRKLGQ